jgi:hypothetical protein
MAISSSSNRSAWTAKALIFSGRPDPNWPLSDADVARFMSLWNASPPTLDAMPAESRLGYRGCIVSDGAHAEWHAYNGLVVHASGNRQLARQDVDRNLERAIVSSAPAGLLPANLIG